MSEQDAIETAHEETERLPLTLVGVPRFDSAAGPEIGMQESNIAWTDVTWNPTHGCSKVSAGCDNCYAERISRQYEHTEHPWTNEYAQENVTERPDKLEEPYGIEPSRIFVNSMSDLFHSAISEDFIRDVFAVMRNISPGQLLMEWRG